MVTTAVVGIVMVIKEFRLDKIIFVRDNIFYIAAVCLLFYIFTVPGRIRLVDSILLSGLYLLYVAVVLISKRYISDKPLQSLRKLIQVKLVNSFRTNTLTFVKRWRRRQ